MENQAPEKQKTIRKRKTDTADKAQDDRTKIRRQLDDIKLNMKYFKQWSLRERTGMGKQMKEQNPVQMMFKLQMNQSKRHLLIKKVCHCQAVPSGHVGGDSSNAQKR